MFNHNLLLQLMAWEGLERRQVLVHGLGGWEMSGTRANSYLLFCFFSTFDEVPGVLKQNLQK